MAADVNLVRRRFTVDDYHRMGEVGILNEDDRVELIRGDIVHMTPIGTRHAACVARLNELLLARLRGRATLWPQNPLISMRPGCLWRTTSRSSSKPRARRCAT